jgi:hypothetical protein
MIRKVKEMRRLFPKKEKVEKEVKAVQSLDTYKGNRFIVERTSAHNFIITDMQSNEFVGTHLSYGDSKEIGEAIERNNCTNVRTAADVVKEMQMQREEYGYDI